MSLSIVIDVNLSPEWVPYLTANGLAAQHCTSIGSERATDSEIMSWATSNGYVILTHDLDFGTLLAITHAVGPSVLTLRGRGVLPADVGDTVLGLLRTYASELETGAMLVYDQRHARVRLLPF